MKLRTMLQKVLPTNLFGIISKFRLFKLVWVLLVLVSFIGITTPAKASIYAGSNAGWIVVSSHSDLQTAIGKARQYSGNFPSAIVFQSTNGYFAVSIGWAPKTQGDSFIRLAIIGGLIPGDAYIHNGKRWARAVWSANNAHQLSGNSFLRNSRFSGAPSAPTIQPPIQQQPRVTPLTPTTALVSGLKFTGSNYLSLRQGPDTSYAEIVRMRPDTRLTITGKANSWYQVKLQNGMTGFAHSRYIRIAEIRTLGPERNPVQEVPTIGPRPVLSVAKPPLDNADNDSRLSQPTAQKSENKNISLSDQKRVALVLGNSKYEHTSELANPKNDADAMAMKLEALGFTVIKGLDQSKSAMESSIRDFVRELPGADVALFFYAGHAIQVSGVNYLIPVNASLEDSTAIDFETINFSVILNFMNAPDRTSIALLDACRNNPLARSFTRKLGKTRSSFVGRGLAAPTSGEGQLLIGFATAPGEVALDGDGINSPFTTALLKHMATPGLEIELMLKRVKADVFNETDGSQSPWNNSALRKEFYFAR